MEDNLINNDKNINNISDNLENDQIVKPTNKKSTIFNFILVAIIFVGLFIYMILVDGIDNIVNLLKNVNYWWVLAGLGCLIIQWICDAICLHIPIKRLYTNQSFGNSFKIAMIGQLFNNVTPFSSGGQPMQAYEFSKTGKRVSDSFSAMAIKFIITQTALVIFTFTVILFQFNFFASIMKDFLWVAVVGFTINILVILVVILAGMKKRVITIISNPIITLLGKIKIFKNPEKIKENFDKSLDNFGEQFNIMKSEKKMVLKIFITACVQSFAYYSITYMVYRAFGNFGVNFWQIIPVQAFLLLLMTFIPTPGAGIGAEGGFLVLFQSIFKNGTINMSILFWRLYTFYLPIIIGALFLIPINKKNKSTKIFD